MGSIKKAQLFLTVLLCFGALCAPAFSYEGVDQINPREWRTVCEARMDIAFEDGTIYLYSIYGEDFLKLNREYRLIDHENHAFRLQFSRLAGKMLVAKITPAEAVRWLPKDELVSISTENLAQSAKFKTGSPEPLKNKLKPITSRSRATQAPFGITAEVGLIPSDREMLFYFGQYTALQPGDVVEVSNALGTRVKAEVVKSTGQFVQLNITYGSAHFFHEKELVVVRDAAAPMPTYFITQPYQLRLPDEIPRFVEPSKPKALQDKAEQKTEEKQEDKKEEKAEEKKETKKTDKKTKK